MTTMHPASRGVLALLLAAGAAAATANDAVTLDLQSVEPRAFGYQVGDLVQRRFTIRVPPGLALDEASLPRPGARGTALELRAVERRAAAQREDLLLVYQVFLAPTAVRTLEMPSLTLRFAGSPRDQDLRIDAWPVTVAPLVPVDVSPRRGLGELQPDTEPPLLDTAPTRARLIAIAAGIAALLGWLAAVYFGLPWSDRRRRPFTRAWRRVRALPAAPAQAPWRDACRQVHAALDETAGAVLFERDVRAFGERHPAFAGLRDDIRRFLQLSRREFFADGAHEVGDAAWLVGFCRRCRDAERGT